jgi:transcriptional regulator with XRE-family HTH domain
MSSTTETTLLDITKINRSMVARETGVDLAHISRIFNLKATPSLYLACRIATTLEITVDSLCDALRIDSGPEQRRPEIRSN